MGSLRWLNLFLLVLFPLLADIVEDASDLRDNGRVDEAITKLKSAGSSGDIGAEQLLAKLYLDTEQYPEAIKIYTKICPILKSYECYNELGISYITSGIYSDAVTAFQKSLELQPNFATGYSNLAQAHLMLGEIDKSESNHKKALELSPNNPIIRINYGVFLVKMKRYQRAKDVLYPVVAENDSLFYAELYIGIAHYFREEYHSALIHFNRGLAINPEYYDLYYYRALLYYKKGEYSDSLEDLKMVDKLFPTNEKSIKLKKIIMKNSKI